MSNSKPRFFWVEGQGWYNCSHKKAIQGFDPEDRGVICRFLGERSIERFLNNKEQGRPTFWDRLIETVLRGQYRGFPWGHL